MVKHIVVYTFREGVDKAEGVKLVASCLERLVGVIPGLLKMEIRPCFQGGIPSLLSWSGCVCVGRRNQQGSAGSHLTGGPNVGRGEQQGMQ